MSGADTAAELLRRAINSAEAASTHAKQAADAVAAQSAELKRIDLAGQRQAAAEVTTAATSIKSAVNQLGKLDALVARLERRVDAEDRRRAWSRRGLVIAAVVGAVGCITAGAAGALALSPTLRDWGWMETPGLTAQQQADLDWLGSAYGQRLRRIGELAPTTPAEGALRPCIGWGPQNWTVDGQPVTTCVVRFQ